MGQNLVLNLAEKGVKSTNGTLHIILMGFGVAATLFSLSGEQTSAIIATLGGAVAAFALLRDLYRKGDLVFSLSWKNIGNSVVYLTALLIALFPQLTEAWELIPDIVNDFASGAIGKALSTLIVFINFIWQTVKG
jgi:hypothetical protein